MQAQVYLAAARKRGHRLDAYSRARRACSSVLPLARLVLDAKKTRERAISKGFMPWDRPLVLASLGLKLF